MIVFLILLTIHLLNELYTPSDGVNIAIFGALASTFGNIVNYQQQQDFQRKQIEMQRETNHLNWMMNERNNVYNSMLAEKMFNLENEYNTPKNQMKRLREAGINPFVAASTVGNVEGRADTIPAQQPIAMVSPMAGLTAPQYNLGATLGADFANIASAIGALAQAKKAGAETDKIERSLDWEIEGLQLQNLNERAKLRVNNIQAIISEMYGLKGAGQNIEKADKEIGNLVKRGLLYDEEIDIAKVEYLLKDVEHGIKHKDYQRYDEQLNALIEQIKDMNVLILEQRNTEKARQTNEYSQAGEHNARAESIRKQTKYDESIRENLRTLMRNSAQMSENEMVDYYSTRYEVLHEIFESARRAGYVTDEQISKARKAAVEGDYAPQRELLNSIGQAVGIGTSVYGAKTGRIGATNKSYDYFETDSEGNSKRGYRRYGR